MEQNKKNLSPELQELLEKAFPAYNGETVNVELIASLAKSAKEENYKSAMEYASQFDSDTATSADWYRLDWALSVPGVAEEFPELAMELQMYYTLQIPHKDFVEVVANIILCATNIANDTVNAEDTIKCFEPALKQYLPEELSFAVKCLLEKEMCNQCRAKGLPVDQEIMDRYFYRLEA